MPIIITIRIDIEKPNGCEADLETIGREIARDAGLQTRLLPAQYAVLGRDFTMALRRQVESWINAQALS